jgi:hypothetical protein
VAQTFLQAQGVFGVALGVMFTYVFLFVVLGALLELTRRHRVHHRLRDAHVPAHGRRAGQGRRAQRGADGHAVGQRRREHGGVRHVHDPDDAQRRLPARPRRPACRPPPVPAARSCRR